MHVTPSEYPLPICEFCRAADHATILTDQYNLLSIASFLSIHDVRNLSSTCSAIRCILLTSEAATKLIWVNQMIESFPAVFRSINEQCNGYEKSIFGSRRITLEIDYHLAKSQLPDGIDVNFQLISSLLPKRYPQSIDPNTFIDDDGSFRTYQCDQSCMLIQFLGQVGIGNRSIRSDFPFPPTCREVSSTRSNGSGVCFRSRKNISCSERKNGGSKFISSTFLPDSLPRRESMSSSTTNPSSSENSGQDCTLSFGPFTLDETTRSAIDNSDQIICTNHVVPFRQTLTRFFCNVGKTKKTLIPYTIPTVTTKSRRADCSQCVDLVVDVTPRRILYFEVTLTQRTQFARHGQRNDCVAVGLSTKSFQTECSFPGWDDESFGYHSDDGGMFNGNRVAARLGQPKFGPGDTIGCGVEYSSRRIFFTKNAEFLGYEFGRIRKRVVEKGLYPTVGIDTDCPIFVNFGEHPFLYNLKDFQF